MAAHARRAMHMSVSRHRARQRRPAAFVGLLRFLALFCLDVHAAPSGDHHTCGMQPLRATKGTCRKYCSGGRHWEDSFEVMTKEHGAVCYCKTSFDHGIGAATMLTPGGCKTIKTICGDIVKKYGQHASPRAGTRGAIMQPPRRCGTKCRTC